MRLHSLVVEMGWFAATLTKQVRKAFRINWDEHYLWHINYVRLTSKVETKYLFLIQWSSLMLVVHVTSPSSARAARGRHLVSVGLPDMAHVRQHSQMHRWYINRSRAFRDLITRSCNVSVSGIYIYEYSRLNNVVFSHFTVQVTLISSNV